jgi:hypothetical protein
MFRFTGGKNLALFVFGPAVPHQSEVSTADAICTSRSTLIDDLTDRRPTKVGRLRFACEKMARRTRCQTLAQIAGTKAAARQKTHTTERHIRRHIYISIINFRFNPVT